MDVEQLIYEVRGAAMEVYNFFGPGLLESVYEKALVRELELRGLEVKTQLSVPIVYKDAVVGDELRIDILVENELIVELKSIEEFKPVYCKQLRTYLKLLNKDVGLLINFGEYDFKKGMRRIAL